MMSDDTIDRNMLITTAWRTHYTREVHVVVLPEGSRGALDNDRSMSLRVGLHACDACGHKAPVEGVSLAIRVPESAKRGDTLILMIDPSFARTLAGGIEQGADECAPVPTHTGARS